MLGALVVLTLSGGSMAVWLTMHTMATLMLVLMAYVHTPPKKATRARPNRAENSNGWSEKQRRAWRNIKWQLTLMLVVANLAINANNLKHDRNPDKLVLIWEYPTRAIQWIPTWQGLGVFYSANSFKNGLPPRPVQQFTAYCLSAPSWVRTSGTWDVFL